MSVSDPWNPVQYDKFKAERSQPFFDLIEMLEPARKARVPRVADLGCGSGELTTQLHKRAKAAKTVGIDSSRKMLEKAHSFASEGLTFELGYIQHWKPVEPFDMIVSNAALHWCADHPGIFETLKNALAPSGQIAVQMPTNHDYCTHVLAGKMSREDPWDKLLKGEAYERQNVLAPEEYAHLLFRLGFKEQKVLVRVYGHILESRKAVIEWVKGTLLTHFESRLSKSDFGSFLSEYKKRLFQELPDEKPFFYPFKRIFIWARL